MISSTKTVHEIGYKKLDDFIKSVTGQEYECVCAEEWSNDSEHHFVVTGKLDNYDREEWNQFRALGGKDSSFILGAILNGLCEEGHLPAGDYLISVCW